jgi:type IV fimbrial biogenesis protein FimT
MKQSGTTLPELMVVLAVAAILLMIGVPSFASLANNSRLAVAANEVLASLYLARAEAIKRNARAVACASATGTSCADSGGWEQGWIVFHDANNNAAVDPGEPVILVRPKLPTGFVLTAIFSFGSKYVSYSPTGGAKLTSGAWQFGSLTLCHTSAPELARKIIVNTTGRPRIQKLSLSSCP